MHRKTRQTQAPPTPLTCVLISSAFLAALGMLPGANLAQSATPTAQAPHTTTTAKSHSHRSAKKPSQPAPIAEAPPPPPAPHWPINDSPNPPSVAWDSSGLRISASNSSLQQILNEVSTDTGTRIVGSVPDQRIYGSYGPGNARDVLSQLLLGSGYNVLLAGDIGKGAPSEVVLTPRRSSGANAPNSVNRSQQQDPDEDIPEQPEEEQQPQVQQQPPPMLPEIRPATGPNGPMRTPQQVMEEMQQRQLLQQQQMQQQIQQQQQQQQNNPQQ